MAKGMKAEFRTPVCRGDAGADQRRPKTAVHDIGVVFDVPSAGRKDKPKIAIRTGKPPFPQRIDDDRRQRDRSLAGFRLGLADGAVAVCALADV